MYERNVVVYIELMHKKIMVVGGRRILEKRERITRYHRDHISHRYFVIFIGFLSLFSFFIFSFFLFAFLL